MKVGDVFVALGVKADDRGLKQFDSGVKSLRLNVALTAAAFTGALYALDRFVTSSVRGATAMMNFQTQTGLSLEELQRWQNAATLSNTALSVDQVTASITGLQARLADIQINGGGQAFQRLGISTIGKDAFAVLNELRRKIGQVSRPVASNLIQEMGLTPEFLNVLTLSNDEFERLANTFSRSADMQRRLVALGVTLAEFRKNLDLIQSEIVVKLIPVFDGLIKVLEGSASLVARLSSNLEKLWNSGPQAQTWMSAVAIGIGAIAARLAPVTAGVVALLLVLDDLATYAAGGDSLTGRVVEGVKGLGLDDLKTSPPGSFITKNVDDLMYALSPPPTYKPHPGTKMRRQSAADPGQVMGPDGVYVDADAPVPGSTAADVPDGQLPREVMANMLPAANINVTNNIHTRDDPDAIAAALGADSTQVKNLVRQWNNGAKN